MNLYAGEVIKIIMYFDNGLTYVSYNNNKVSDKRFIIDIDKDEKESEKYTTIFGVVSSNRINIKLFDSENLLLVSNHNSPYFSYMREGVKIEIKLCNQNKEEIANYGTFYTTKWSSGFSDGFTDVVNIQARDELDYILQNDMPKLPVFAGIEAGSLIIQVLTKCGVDKNRIKIDSALKTSLLYGTTEDDKVGYFLNDILQALGAVMIINNNNEILIMKSTRGYGKQYRVDLRGVEKIHSNNNEKNIYSRVKVNFEKQVGRELGTIHRCMIKLKSGINKIQSLLFSNKVLGIDEIRVEHENDELEVLNFSSYQNGIDLNIKSNKDLEDAELTILGEKVITVKSSVSSNINHTDKKKVVSLNINNNYITNEEDAQEIANEIAKFIEMNNQQIVIDTVFTPLIEEGDILEFIHVDGRQDIIIGYYKVIEARTVFNKSYLKRLKIVPLGTNIVWDDSKVWDDSIQWLDNNEISQA